jgi:hypothetical protein
MQIGVFKIYEMTEVSSGKRSCRYLDQLNLVFKTLGEKIVFE